MSGLLRDETYEQYLRTAWWRGKRAKAIKRADECCEFCGQPSELAKLHVHHLSYDRLGGERDHDLIVLCWSCHADVHEFPQIAQAVERVAWRRWIS